MAIIQLEAGLAPLELPRCAVIFMQQHRFFDKLARAAFAVLVFSMQKRVQIGYKIVY